MKTKLLIQNVVGFMIVLNILYMLFHSHPSDPFTYDGGAHFAKNEPKIHPPKLTIVHAGQQQEPTLSIKDKNSEAPALEPPAHPNNRDNRTIEPAPEAADEIGMSDSVEIMEIELTGMLLDYDISDEKIDEILDKIRGDREDMDSADASPVAPADYLKRLQFMARLIDQSNMDADQLAMIVEDVFNAPPNTTGL